MTRTTWWERNDFFSAETRVLALLPERGLHQCRNAAVPTCRRLLYLYPAGQAQHSFCEGHFCNSLIAVCGKWSQWLTAREHEPLLLLWALGTLAEGGCALGRWLPLVFHHLNTTVGSHGVYRAVCSIWWYGLLTETQKNGCPPSQLPPKQWHCTEGNCLCLRQASLEARGVRGEIWGEPICLLKAGNWGAFSAKHHGRGRRPMSRREVPSRADHGRGDCYC